MISEIRGDIMKYNFSSEKEANEFLDKIADPMMIRDFALKKLGIKLPLPPLTLLTNGGHLCIEENYNWLVKSRPENDDFYFVH